MIEATMRNVTIHRILEDVLNQVMSIVIINDVIPPETEFTLVHSITKPKEHDLSSSVTTKVSNPPSPLNIPSYSTDVSQVDPESDIRAQQQAFSMTWLNESHSSDLFLPDMPRNDYLQHPPSPPLNSSSLLFDWSLPFYQTEDGFAFSEDERDWMINENEEKTRIFPSPPQTRQKQSESFCLILMRNQCLLSQSEISVMHNVVALQNSIIYSFQSAYVSNSFGSTNSFRDSSYIPSSHHYQKSHQFSSSSSTFQVVSDTISDEGRELDGMPHHIKTVSSNNHNHHRSSFVSYGIPGQETLLHDTRMGNEVKMADFNFKDEDTLSVQSTQSQDQTASTRKLKRSKSISKPMNYEIDDKEFPPLVTDKKRGQDDLILNKKDQEEVNNGGRKFRSGSFREEDISQPTPPKLIHSSSLTSALEDDGAETKSHSGKSSVSQSNKYFKHQQPSSLRINRPPFTSLSWNNSFNIRGFGGGILGEDPLHSLLSEEISNFTIEIGTIVSDSHTAKTVALSKLRSAVISLWPRAQVKPFGSFVTGLSLPSSDVDVVICLPKVHSMTPADAPGVLEGANNNNVRIY